MTAAISPENDDEKKEPIIITTENEEKREPIIISTPRRELAEMATARLPPLEGATVTQLAPPVLEPISAGPIVYYANSKAAAFRWIVFLAQIIVRVIFIVWILFESNFRTHHVLLWVLFIILYAASFCNIWLTKMANFRKHMTILRYSRKLLFKTSIVWLFLLDEITFFILPFLLFGVLKYYPSIFLLGLLMAIFNAVAFVIIMRFETSEHSPLAGGERFVKSSKKEFIGMKENQLRILESAAFRLVIVNIGDRPVEGNILVVRSVSFSGTVIIPLFLASPLHPGVSMTLIPETHTTSGAFKIQNYRSFGQDKGTINTEIYTNGNFQRFSVRMQEIYVHIDGTMDTGPYS